MQSMDTDPTPARMRRRVVAVLVAGIAVLAFVGCGSDKDESDQAQAPAATLPGATTTTGTETQATTPDSVTTEPEDQPGGAGDEEGIEVQVSLLLDNGKIVPEVSKVQAFLPVEVVVVSTDGLDRELTIDTGDGKKKTFKVNALEQKTVHLPALSKGDHAIDLDGKQAGKLSAGS